MVSALVTLLFMSVVQVGVALHVRNTLIACASEGARLGARADTDPAEGGVRTRGLITASLAARFAGDVSVTVDDVDGVQVVTVRVVAPLPLIGLLGPDRAYDLVGRAYREAQ